MVNKLKFQHYMNQVVIDCRFIMYFVSIWWKYGQDTKFDMFYFN